MFKYRQVSMSNSILEARCKKMYALEQGVPQRNLPPLTVKELSGVGGDQAIRGR